MWIELALAFMPSALHDPQRPCRDLLLAGVVGGARGGALLI